MPANYTHYRFGAAQFAAMSADVRRPIQRHRRLFDVGLHGPDIFFYYNPIASTVVGDLGSVYHGQTGQKFFTRAGRMLRLTPSEPALSYLYGLLCHYALDSVIHPYVRVQKEKVSAKHIEMEMEFDRWLLERDGKTPPHAQDLSAHLRLTAAEAAVAAKFFPPATGRQISACIRNMTAGVKLMTASGGVSRKIVETGARLLGGRAANALMPTGPNPACAHLDEEFMALYRKAEARFPRLLEEMGAHLACGAPLGKLFAEPFD